MVSQQINSSPRLHEVLRVFCFLSGSDESVTEVLSAHRSNDMNTQSTYRILSPQSSVMAEHPGRAGMLLDQLFDLGQVVLLDRISLRPTLAFGQADLCLT